MNLRDGPRPMSECGIFNVSNFGPIRYTLEEKLYTKEINEPRIMDCF